MSRTFTASLILILSFALGICTLAYIEKSCSEMIDMIDSVILSVQKEDTEKIAKNLSTAVESWEEKRPLLNLMIGQDDTTQIREDLNKTIYFCNAKDYESAIIYLQECKVGLNSIITTNEPTPSTIF